VHTSFSDDCAWPLAKVIAPLRALGFHGALVCEHDRTMTDTKWREVVATCARLSGPGFLLVPGIEYQDPTHTVHVPVFGDVPFLGRSPDIDALLTHAERHRAVSVFAHPARRHAYRDFDPAWADRLTAIEIWNRKYDGLAPNSWATAVAAEHRLQRFVSLDFHGPRQLFPLAVSVDLPAGPAPVRAEEVIAAILAGRSRPRALWSDPDRWATGAGGAVAARTERLRRSLAPRVRRLEEVLGR
jgi:hypothetical protein